MQTPEQRRYWAERRKHAPAKASKPRTKVVIPPLLASSHEEYVKLKSMYPDRKISFHQPTTQIKLFDTREFKDD